MANPILDVERTDLKPRKYDRIYANGRFCTFWSNPSANKQTQTLRSEPQGVLDPLVSTETTGGSLQLTAETEQGVSMASRLLAGFDPDVLVGQYIDPNENKYPVLFENLMAADKSHWVGARWYGPWSASPVGDSNRGGPNDNVPAMFTGATENELRIVDAHLWVRHVPLTVSGDNYVYTTSVTPGGGAPYQPAAAPYPVMYVQPGATGSVANSYDWGQLYNSGQYVSASTGFVSIPTADCAHLGFTPTSALVYGFSSDETSLTPTNEVWEDWFDAAN